jgi:methyl-accepting chemotaxis protein
VEDTALATFSSSSSSGSSGTEDDHNTKYDYDRRELIRRLRLTRTIAFVLAGTLLASALFSLSRLFLTEYKAEALFFLSLSAVCVLAFITSGWLCQYSLRRLRLSPSATSTSTPSAVGATPATATATTTTAVAARKRANIAGIILVGTITLTASFVQLSYQSSDGSLTTGFLILPVIAALLGLSRRLTLLAAVGGGIALVTTYFLSRSQLPGGSGSGSVVGLTTGAATWLGAYSIIAVCILAFTAQIRRANEQERLSRERAESLVRALSRSTQVSGQLSYDLSGGTLELDELAREQAQTVQEQAAAIAQVTTSMEELSETAAQIALTATAVASAAATSLTVATGWGAESRQVREVSREGTRAVTDVVVGQDKLRERVEVLAQKLVGLTANVRKVGGIVTLIDEIADETHLLALNAGVEAAGTIQISEPLPIGVGIGVNSSTYTHAPAHAPTSIGANANTSRSGGGGIVNNSGSNRQGERFMVIAQEVRNLADRGREATEEVRQAINEIQGAVAAAVLVAEEVKKEAAGATGRASIAGGVIEKLNEVIEQSANEANFIVESAREVTLRCEEIRLATGQQQSAGQQVLVSLRTLGDTSQQTAGAITQLSATVGDIARRVAELNEVLVSTPGTGAGADANVVKTISVASS